MARGTYLPKTNKRILEVQTAQAVLFRQTFVKKII